MNTEIQTTTAADDSAELIAGAMARMKQLAPIWLKPERIAALVLSSRSQNPKLAQCTTDSVVGFCLKCAETGLEPIGAGGAWAIPYRDYKTNRMEMQFIPDWRGLIFLAKKAKQINAAYTAVVHAGDVFTYQLGDDPKCVHKPQLTGRGDVVGAYCILTLPDGSKHVEYMSVDELEAIRKRSKAAQSGPWVTDTEEMYRKTVLKRALKPFATSPELKAAIDADNSFLGNKVAIVEPEKPVFGKNPFAEKVVGVQPEPTEPTEPKTPADKPADERLISEVQGRRLFAICHAKGITMETLRAHTFGLTGKKNSKELNRTEYDQICKWAEAGGDGDAKEEDGDGDKLPL